MGTGIVDNRTRDRLSLALTVILLFALLAAIASAIYLGSQPGAHEDPYTEFYILGPHGDADGYPTNLTVGETGEFIVGITNNEFQDLTYTVVLVSDDEELEMRSVTVEDGETSEDEMTFTVDEPGQKQLHILLFVGDNVDSLDDPYRELRLIIEVRQ